MPSLSKFSKGQFFVLTAFAIVSVLYFVSNWLRASTITDTSVYALDNDVFVFENIVSKANQTVTMSKSCEELNYNLEEYKNFVTKSLGKKYYMIFEYKIDCSKDPVPVNFNITEITLNSKLNANFTSYMKK